MRSRIGIALVIALLGCDVASAATFAAISYNKETGLYGFSKGYSTREDAEERAAQECGPSCETLIWARDACAALATGSDLAYGSAWNADLAFADADALVACSEHADDCAVVVEACSDQ